MELTFSIIPTTGEFLIYRDKVNSRYVGIPHEDMIDVRKLKNAFGEYDKIPPDQTVRAVPLQVQADQNTVVLDADRVEELPCNCLETVSVLLP
ncbi:hypothetical protein [Compostibacter hankyongensis]|uniref:Uncharacterized protein n=1 Tax=Compostibacter hankyongensis TaxID=1007089 RepID=A0ABP8FG72_9BACT